MPVSLSSLVPSADDLLTLEVEEVAGVLLAHLRSFGNDSGNGVVSRGAIGQYNFFNTFGQSSEYPTKHDEVWKALMEAWNWLEREGLLVRDASQTQSPWFFLSRRAQRLNSREDLAVYRRASSLPKGQLHPLIATRVYPAFLRGEYDTAVFQAFREVEIAVREVGRFSADDVGVDLMRQAFRLANPDRGVNPGPLTETTLPAAEQDGMRNLFTGAIALYRNPQSHRYVPTDVTDAAEVIGFASQLLRIVDRLK
jgi:uncharacterized protein (TIGR02391 family)